MRKNIPLLLKNNDYSDFPTTIGTSWNYAVQSIESEFIVEEKKSMLSMQADHDFLFEMPFIEMQKVTWIQ